MGELYSTIRLNSLFCATTFSHCKKTARMRKNTETMKGCDRIKKQVRLSRGEAAGPAGWTGSDKTWLPHTASVTSTDTP